MYKSVLATFSLLMACSTATADWVRILKQPDFELYVAPDRITKAGKNIRGWVMYSYDTPRELPTSPAASFSSQVIQQEFDCVNQATRKVSLFAYEEKKALGNMIANLPFPTTDPLVPIPPNSVIEDAYNYYCKPQKRKM